MSWSSKQMSARALGAALVLGSVLAGCSDIYYDRRETIAFGAEDAVATNKAVQTIDPWPRAAANRDISVNGAVVESAIERYRMGRVIPPRGTGTSSAGYAQQPLPQQQPQLSGAGQTPVGTPVK